MDAVNQSTTPEPAETALDAMPVTARLHNARRLEQARHIGFWWQSRRQVARRLGVPDSSFRYSLRQHDQRCQNHRLPRPLVEFCESTAGLEFLQQLLVALHLVFGQANDCGLRSISQFLRLSGLDQFLPPSFGAQQAFAAQLETELDEYGRQEEQRLAAQMPPREITVCEDETFHPQICLVAIEPVSDYLLLEQHAPQRDAETWNHRLDERLADWPVRRGGRTKPQSRRNRRQAGGRRNWQPANSSVRKASRWRSCSRKRRRPRPPRPRRGNR